MSHARPGTGDRPPADRRPSVRHSAAPGAGHRLAWVNRRFSEPFTRRVAAVAALVVALTLAVGALRGEGGSEPLPAAGPPPGAAVTVGWVGDTVLGSVYGVPADGGRELLSELRPQLTGSDVMIGNLEGVIGSAGTPKCPVGTTNCYAFQAPPVAANTLAWAGFDVMNLANNHAFDYGAPALDETVGHLQAAGVHATGRPGQITLVRRGETTLAVLGFAPYPWAARLDDIPAAVELVRRARELADVVVVTMHAGAEGADHLHTPVGEEVAYGESRGNTRGFAHAVIDAGAHVVLGSGPHVVRGVERRGDALIVYSTGNFAGFHNFNMAGDLALAAFVEVTIDSSTGRILDGRWLPVRIVSPGRPTVDTGEANSAVLAARLSELDFEHPGLRSDGSFVLDDQ